MVFWALAAIGFGLLGFVTFVHLFCINLPPTGKMSPIAYQSIGYICLVVLGVAVYGVWRWILPDWVSVREVVARSR